MPERPVECSQCKKPAKVIYKEIIGKTTTTCEMCADCPVLLKKLHGISPEQTAEGKEEIGAGLYCGHCHTSLESIKMGNPIGCSQCYTIFEDLLVQELIAENKLPKGMESARRNQPLHIGKTPDKPVNIPPSNRLTTLNEALNDALKKENYEEAAWLRDQIKELMGKKDE
ncbi:MAG: Protein-arginine kinase activator protein [Chlamydiae bacterium]|nr:Protein-arginine kinase activator protein [Chlamydiota bacterium]